MPLRAALCDNLPRPRLGRGAPRYRFGLRRGLRILPVVGCAGRWFCREMVFPGDGFDRLVLVRCGSAALAIPSHRAGPARIARTNRMTAGSLGLSASVAALPHGGRASGMIARNIASGDRYRGPEMLKFSHDSYHGLNLLLLLNAERIIVALLVICGLLLGAFWGSASMG